MDLSLSNSLVSSATLNPDKLSLDLQFATDKTLTACKGPTPTFTRASTATFVGSDGLIQSAAINAARFDHDPITLACKGLLIEESRTNLLARSAEIENAYWTNSGVTTAGNDQISPDGNLNADTITAGASSIPSIYRAVSCVASTAYTLSFYIKIGTLTLNEFKFAVRDDTNGVFIDQNIIPNVTPVTTEWRRVVYTFTTPVGCVLVRPYLSRFSSTTEGTFSIWGAQLEQGSFPTSYIPTTTASVVRSADVCSITGSDFTGMYNQSEGSFACNYSIPAGFTGNRYATAIEDTAGGLINAYTFRNTNSGINFINTGGYLSIIGAITTGLSKHIIAYSGVSEFVYCKDGTIGSNTGSGTRDPSVFIRMSIGTLEAANSFSLNGHIASIRYFKKRLSNAKLQTLTT